MNLIALCSTIAIVIGLASALPQLACMVRARSAAGQSAVGWTLGIGVNLLMTYVNGVGYDAGLLAAGNVASVLLCLVAVVLVRRFGAGPAAGAAAEAVPVVAFHELPTGELQLLRGHLDEEAERRRAAREERARAAGQREPAFALA